MAPLAPSNTARFRFFYTVIGVQHSIQIRTSSSPASIAGFMNAYWSAFATELFGLTVDFVTFAAIGSDIFNLVTTGLEGNTYGTGAGSQENIPWAYTFIGRSPGGRRVRITQFGAKQLSGNYRTTAGEHAQIDAVIGILQILPSQLLAVDGLVPVWKTYADNQVNDHWVKEVRP